jgi:RimJ/RimL family protein N-acetyltransferase
MAAFAGRPAFYANINPRNEKSAALFRSLGFELARREPEQDVYELLRAELKVAA